MDFTNADNWRALPLDMFWPIGEGFVWPPKPRRASAVYRSSEEVPSHLMFRVSDSKKRLSAKLSQRTEQSLGHMAELHSIVSGEAVIGFVIALNQDMVARAYALPDGVNLVAKRHISAADKMPILKPCFKQKTMTAVLLGPSGGPDTELILTSHKRWFLDRCNPKHLGFAKGSK